jgi:poly(ADP-ribose) glycohydrolase
MTEFPDWSKSLKPLRKWEIRRHGSISDAEDAIHIDFANRFLGGGVISGGCVQEEILFAVNSELIPLCLFCEAMSDNEAIIMRGSIPYSKCNGYGLSLTFGEDIKETHKETVIAAMDAIDYRHNGVHKQFHINHFHRELKKAYVAFSKSDKKDDPENNKKISTGKWGCGAFLGDVSWKSLLQYLAASEAERDLIFYTVNDPLTDELISTAKLLEDSKRTVGDLYSILKDYSDNKNKIPVNALQHARTEFAKCQTEKKE